MRVGYARVSTTGQSLAVQLAELAAQQCDKVFQDKRSGSNTDREGLAQCLDFVREGDVLIVTRLDRFARSSRDLHALIAQLDAKGVGFQCVHQSIDTTSSVGKLTLAILGGVAEFENDIRRERQREGIDDAKQRGVYKRTRRIDVVEVRKLIGEGHKPSDVARLLSCSRMTVHRAINNGE